MMARFQMQQQAKAMQGMPGGNPMQMGPLGGVQMPGGINLQAA